MIHHSDRASERGEGRGELELDLELAGALEKRGKASSQEPAPGGR